MSIWLRRVYDKPTRNDGYRVLVDRIWPRGISKEDAKINAWLKEAAPSSSLRKWFGHSPQKWQEFKDRYFKELESRPQAIQELLHKARKGRVTLVYAAKDERFNNAVALKAYLQSALS
jgi:uncharacterized protein YeaO (DUF488 family)